MINGFHGAENSTFSGDSGRRAFCFGGEGDAWEDEKKDEEKGKFRIGAAVC